MFCSVDEISDGYRTALASGVLDVVDEIVKLVRAQERHLGTERELFAAMVGTSVKDEVLLSMLYDSLVKQYSVKRRIHSRQKSCMLACFLWAMCFVTYDAAVSSLMLLFGDRSTNTISRVGLARALEHIATYQKGAKPAADNRRIIEVVDEIFYYSEALEQADIWRRMDKEHGLADSIPIPLVVRYLRKSKKLLAWPLRMVQDQLRKILMGSAYWETARMDYHYLFGDNEGQELDVFIVASTVFDLHVKLRQPARRHRRKNSSRDDTPTMELAFSPTSVSSVPSALPMHENGGASSLSSLLLPMGTRKSNDELTPVPTPRPSCNKHVAASESQDHRSQDPQLENLENFHAPIMPSWGSIPIYVDV